MSYTVLVTAPELATEGRALLENRQCRILTLKDFSDVEGLKFYLSTERVDAIISRTMTIDLALMNFCPSLKVISKHGVGVSNIDLDAAKSKNIAVYSTPGANTASVIELTIGLLLSASRHIITFDRTVKAGQWNRSSCGLQLSGKTLAIIGFGQIGRGVAKVAQAIGMKVIVLDPFIDRSLSTKFGVEIVSNLDELLPRAQFLTLHCPADRAANPILNEHQFNLMPKGAVIVNTARGELINELALFNSLKNKHLSAAGLDSFSIEPVDPNNPLLSLDNVICTPHIGGSTPDALSKMATMAVSNILSHLDTLTGKQAINTQQHNRIV